MGNILCFEGLSGIKTVLICSWLDQQIENLHLQRAKDTEENQQAGLPVESCPWELLLPPLLSGYYRSLIRHDALLEILPPGQERWALDNHQPFRGFRKQELTGSGLGRGSVSCVAAAGFKLFHTQTIHG